MSRFDEIYANDEWEAGSGLGSLPSATRGYQQFLQGFVNDSGAASVVDLGCGDWQFSRYLDWSRVDYTGVDVVASVIERNQERYSGPGISFLLGTPAMDNLPDADLLIVKDVLQHLPNADVHRFVQEVLPRYPRALVTNCVRPPWAVNRDIPAGWFRPLDIRKAPFGVTATKVFSFHGPWEIRRRPRRWRKHTLLVEGVAPR